MSPSFLTGGNEHDNDMLSEIKRRGITYGTALGHKGNDDRRKFAAQRKKAYDELFGKRTSDYSRQKYEAESSEDESFPSQREQKDYMSFNKRNPNNKPFTFGTALGHKGNTGTTKYVDSLDAKFKELFGDGK